MLKSLLLAGFVLTVSIGSALAADGPGAGIDGLGFAAIERDVVSPTDLQTTRIVKGLFDEWAPYEDSDLEVDAADSDPPLTHPVSEAAERFAPSDKVAKEGWGTTLGLLPVPDSKVSLPSPDVRLQERGVHIGALYRF